MKTLLVGINSKFIHSNLAIRYLKEFCGEFDVHIKEYTINNNLDTAVSDIFLQKPDLVAFSCYIWNIEYILKIASTLKKADISLKILLGGPEVSYDPKKFMENSDAIDYIIFGEGEETLREFLDKINKDELLYEVDGLAFRQGEEIIVNKDRNLIQNLDDIKFPYINELDDLRGKMVYYESSRGCPFNCQYCLSSTIHGVRNFSIERVKNDLERLINAGVSQIKFVDRTFNCNKLRTVEIFKYLIELNPNVNFHFEITAELLDDEIIELLSMVPKELFQFEIGVQSTNAETLDIVSRQSSFGKLAEVVKKINMQGNIHIHLDLIAGLPAEDYERFKISFNDVYKLKPQMLQLGFLKLLRGAGLRRRAAEWDIKYRNYPPYEVISTKDITFDEMLKLKHLEDILEKYYNSGKFNKSLSFIISQQYSSPFKFYEEFSQYWRVKGLLDKSHSLNSLYTIVAEFYKLNFENFEVFNEVLKFDYLINAKNYILPEEILRIENNALRPALFEFLSSDNLKLIISSYSDFPAKEVIKRVHAEIFEYDIIQESIPKEKVVLLFDYGDKGKIFHIPEVYNITKKINITL